MLLLKNYVFYLVCSLFLAWCFQERALFLVILVKLLTTFCYKWFLGTRF